MDKQLKENIICMVIIVAGIAIFTSMFFAYSVHFDKGFDQYIIEEK